MAHTTQQQTMLGEAIYKRNQIYMSKRHAIALYLEEVSDLAEIVLSYDAAYLARTVHKHAMIDLKAKETGIQKVYERSWKGKANAITRKLRSAPAAALRRLRQQKT